MYWWSMVLVIRVYPSRSDTRIQYTVTRLHAALPARPKCFGYTISVSNDHLTTSVSELNFLFRYKNDLFKPGRGLPGREFGSRDAEVMEVHSNKPS